MSWQRKVAFEPGIYEAHSGHAEKCLGDMAVGRTRNDSSGDTALYDFGKTSHSHWIDFVQIPGFAASVDLKFAAAGFGTGHDFPQFATMLARCCRVFEGRKQGSK